MEATQMIDDSIWGSADEDTENEPENRGKPIAKLRVLNNKHVPETEFPLYLGENVLGRDENACTLPLLASSVSKRHIAISISALRKRSLQDKVSMEALVWDLGSMNGTRKGHFKLTPHVRYSLSEGDNLVVADIPCQYVSCDLDKKPGKDVSRPCVNGESATAEGAHTTNTVMVTSPHPKETNKTQSKGLSFEQTPSQPVPVSDSDSDREQGGNRDGWRKLVSKSNSHLSSPTCSTFLSPTNKVISESEDESPITPSSFRENRATQRVTVDDSDEAIGHRSKQAEDDNSDIDAEGADKPATSAHPVTFNSRAASDKVQFHLDSDTDVEGDGDGSDGGPKSAEGGATASKAGDAPCGTHPKGARPSSAAPAGLDWESDTDEELTTAPAGSSPKGVASGTVPVVGAEGGLEILDDSDTDLEEEASLLPPLITAETIAPTSLGDTDRLNAPDADSGVAMVPPAGDVGGLSDLLINSDTDAEEEEAGAGQEVQMPPLARFCLPLASLQPKLKCSTPLGASAPSAPAVMSCTDSQEEEEEDFVIAETQSFILETRDHKRSLAEEATQAFCIDPSSEDGGTSRAASFQLGFSNSSLMNLPISMQNTQAFTSVDQDLNQEATQCYVTTPPPEMSSAEDDSDLEATQPYIGRAGRGRPTAALRAGRRGDVCLDETQAYVPESHSDSEGREQRTNVATVETQLMKAPASSTSSGGEEPSRYFSMAETQPMATGDDSDNEEVIPAPHKRRAKRLRVVEDEETQRFANSQLSLAETQPMVTLDDGDNGSSQESDKGNVGRKRFPRRAKSIHLEAGTSGVSSRNRRTRGALAAEMEQAETPTRPPNRPTKGKGNARGKRGKVVPKDETDEEEMEAELDTLKKATLKKRQALEKKREDERQGREERERLEREENKRIERERLEKEEERNKEKERLNKEKERIEQERKELEERERLERERALAEENERLQREKELIEMERQKKEEQERLEVERKEEEERLAQEKERERQEMERQEKEKLERKRKEEEEKYEREEKKRLEREERERLEKEELERKWKEEEKQRLQREKEEKDRLEKEQMEREKEELDRKRKDEEKQRLEREKSEREEKEQIERERLEKEELDRKRKEEEKQRLQREKEEKERLEKEQMEREKEELDRKRKEEEKQRLEREKSEREEKEQIERERLEKEEHERVERKCKEEKERLQHKKAKTNVRLARKEKEQMERDRQEKEERERKLEEENERQVQAERDKERLERVEEKRMEEERIHKEKREAAEREARVSKPPKSSPRGRRVTRRMTAEPPPSEPDPATNTAVVNDNFPAHRTRSRSNSSNSVSSERSSVGAQEEGRSWGRGTGRGRGGGMKRTSQQALEAPIRANNRQRTVATSTPSPTPSGTLSRSNSPNSDISGCSVASQNRGRGGRVRGGRGRKTAQVPKTTLVRSLESSQGQQSSAPKAAASCRKSRKVEGSPDKEETVESQPSTTRGRRKNTKEPFPKPEVKTSPDTRSQSSETPTPSRKRAAPVGRSPVGKAPRTSSGSPGAAGRLRDAREAYKVLFTGVTDEAGERVVTRLGGRLATSMTDMTHLVTDKVRRTVKFLCAMARGVPIVTPLWLEKCGKAGSFLSPNAFIVKDAEQEKKFNFCLQKSLKHASSQPLLQGYNIHVTKAVKPEPVHMKDLICCSGGSFLPKMPSSYKAQTVVVSCEEDWALCSPALAASLPVVSAEFILTGILQQKIDLSHTLPAPNALPQASGGKG